MQLKTQSTWKEGEKEEKKKKEREAVRRIKYNPVKISASAEGKKTEEKSHK